MTSIRGLGLLISFRISFGSDFHLYKDFFFEGMTSFHLQRAQSHLMSSDDLGSPWFISADSPQDRRLKGASRFPEFPEFSPLGFLERRNPIPRGTNGHVLHGRVVADCVLLDPPTSGPSSHRCLLSRWKVSRGEQCAAADSSDVKNEIRYQLLGLYLARNYTWLKDCWLYLNLKATLLH